jgi:C1A family cysteine protease
LPFRGLVPGREELEVHVSDRENIGAFKVRNSWSADWGRNGNFWLRYKDAADPKILQDAWIQHLGHKW